MIRLLKPSIRPLLNKSILCNQRSISSNAISISSEVSKALKNKTPVVSLESTIITHGLPYPENYEMAVEVENLVKSLGAIPATTAFINGIPKVGLNEEELLILSKGGQDKNIKVSRRDIPYIISKKLNGGTTIAGTMILSHLAGIKVFGTGGLGGVHRGGELSLDVSADLDELGRTPVSVICAGPKSILDIKRTMEYLETKGVHVSTMGPKGSNIPGFYCRDSGVSSPYNFETPEEAAKIILAGNSLDLQSGNLFCIPPPESIAMDSDFINNIIEKAIIECEAKGIKGKYITPFLLSEISDLTGGASVKTNMEFVLNNVTVATKIAIELAKLENKESHFTSTLLKSYSNKNAVIDNHNHKGLSSTNIKPIDIGNDNGNDHTDSLTIGSLALDITCKIDNKTSNYLETSNPGTISNSIGGVGYNVSLASSLVGKNLDTKNRLISAVGNDISGQEIINELKQQKFDTSGLFISENEETSKYISINNNNGKLIIACSNMNIIENLNEEHIKNQIKRASSSSSSPLKYILFDGNLNTNIINLLINLSSINKFKLIFEPTSIEKSKKLGDKSLKLNVFPNNQMDLITPNILELKSIYESFIENEKFDHEKWFDIIDSLQINSNFIDKIDRLTKKFPDIKNIIKDGIIQQSIKLLPFIPCLIITNGSGGLIILQLVSDINKATSSLSKNNDNTKVFTVFNKGSILLDDKNLGVIFQYYPAEKVLSDSIVSVSGAGDSLSGALLAELSKDDLWLDTCGEKRNEIISKAQKAAVLALKSNETVNYEITYL